ncbi:nitroreductase family protein [Oscillospiraceae bacterium MB08-C2-2]|nr:nitroreductase family protein [Oscillospiraceae bacterium MB08-C2-2]
MDLMDAIRSRHSVRSYTDQKIQGDTADSLRQLIEACNAESGLHIQLCLDEPEAFSGMMARYGKFSNVRNYIALVGKKSDTLDEKCGYYGEKVVLRAQQLGLSTCWVAMSYSKGKSAAVTHAGEKQLMVIALGYGQNSGSPHKGKSIQQLCQVEGELPSWFKMGMEAVQLAPTAMNQQKFSFELTGSKVKATAGSGFYTKVDLGIARYHFEVGAGENDWQWV